MKTVSRLLLVALAMSLASCVTMPERQRLMLGGRYEELTRRFDVDPASPVPIKTSDLFPVCVAYSKLKRYDKLFPCLDRLERNFKNGDKAYLDLAEMVRDNPTLGSFVNMRTGQERAAILYDVSEYAYLMRAEAFIELGDYPRAVAAAKTALKSISRGSALETRSEIQALGSLGLAYALGGDKDSAQQTLRKLETVQTTSGSGKVHQGEKMVGLARICLALADYQGGLAWLQHDDSAFIRGISDLVYGSFLRGESMWSFQQLPLKYMRNKCLLETGQVQQAKDGFDELLSNPRTQDCGEIYWMLLFDRGCIAEKEGNHENAIGFHQRAVEVIERQRSSIHTEASKIGFVGDKQGVYRHLIAALYSVKRYDSAFEYVERAKSRALVDLLASKKDFAVRAGDDKAVRTLLAAGERAETEMRGEDSSLDRSKTRGLMGVVRERLREQCPELASLVSVTALTFPDAVSLVSSDEALVEYYHSGEDLYVFVLSSGGIQAVKLDESGLVADVQALRKGLETPGPEEPGELCRKLYRRLLQPVEGSLGKPSLVIVLHGVLHYLPMNALHDGNGYLIDRYSISTMPSASAIALLRERRYAATEGMLVLGNPDLRDPRYDLPFAQQEAVNVAATRPHSRILLRGEATEGALRKFGDGYDCIHFATHGQFNSESPLTSSLLLAPDANSDGRLTVDKLYSLQLRANLVTLSACETALSKVANGDDLIGLHRGFLYAGASSILASLWRVDDLATSSLMTAFYQQLRQTNKRDALRAAQQETRKEFPHPYYWAAFQLTGNAR